MSSIPDERDALMTAPIVEEFSKYLLGRSYITRDLFAKLSLMAPAAIGRCATSGKQRSYLPAVSLMRSQPSTACREQACHSCLRRRRWWPSSRRVFCAKPWCFPIRTLLPDIAL